MKKNQFLITTLTFILLSGIIFGQSDILIWNETAEELAQFIKSKDDNKKVFALQRIIENPKIVNSNDLVYDIYRIYKNHQNDRLRQMALMALYKTEYFFLLKNLKDDLYQERNPKIRYQIYKILEKMPVLRDLN